MGVSKRSENVRAKDVLGCMHQGEGPRFPPHPPQSFVLVGKGSRLRGFGGAFLVQAERGLQWGEISRRPRSQPCADVSPCLFCPSPGCGPSCGHQLQMFAFVMKSVAFVAQHGSAQAVVLGSKWRPWLSSVQGGGVCSSLCLPPGQAVLDHPHINKL